VLPARERAGGNNNPKEAGRHDRVPDIACTGGPGRDRAVGGIFVSAEIIPFIPRPNRRSRLAEFLNQTRSAIRQDDLTMDHADTVPCESDWPCEYAVSGEDVTDAKIRH
jgi:hypothetical protein